MKKICFYDEERWTYLIQVKLQSVAPCSCFRICTRSSHLNRRNETEFLTDSNRTEEVRVAVVEHAIEECSKRPYTRVGVVSCRLRYGR